MQEPELLDAPLSERGLLSEKEKKFDEMRQRAGFILAPIIFLLLWFFPVPGLAEKPTAHHLLAVMGLVVTLWVSEAIPLAITALLGPALCVVAGVSSAKDIFKSFADPIIFLFIGSFLLAEGIFHHGLNRRIAFQILGLKAIGTNPTRLMLAFGGIVCVMSMWISNTTTIAMMLPVAISILKEMAMRRSEQVGHEVKFTELKFGTGLMLVMVLASTVGGLATPVGTAPNLIGMGMIERNLGIQIPFFKWMAFGLPIALVLLVFLIIYLKRVFPSEPGLMGKNSSWIAAERAKFGPLSRGEKNVLLAFGVTITFWLLPGALALVFGTEDPVYKKFIARLPESTVALLGAILLFVLPINFRQRKPDWR
jgi:sodium-dependent dicarboxylate transporter 2/3/5